MSRRWTKGRAGTACKAMVALIGATGCLAAVALAAGSPVGLGAIKDARPSAFAGRAPLRPRLTQRPGKTTVSSEVGFAFGGRQRRHHASSGGILRFECRIDGGKWSTCRTPLSLKGLEPGTHRFAVRAMNQGGRRGKSTAVRWRQLKPQRFSIAAGSSPLGPLYPGAAPEPIPLVLTNPSSAPIYVTALTVGVTDSPPGCDAATNLTLIPSTASSTAPLAIPAGGSVSLPAPGVSAPAIGLLDLPFNQDACKNAQFSLAFHGSAYG